jgi:hypothetical protein
MKKMIAVMALLLGACSVLFADDEITNSTHAGFGYPQTGLSWTTALNAVSPTVASAAIDCASYAGLLVYVTGTPGITVQEQWAYASTGPWQKKVSLYAGEPYWRLKQSRYVRFVFTSATVTEIQRSCTVKYSLQQYPGAGGSYLVNYSGTTTTAVSLAPYSSTSLPITVSASTTWVVATNLSSTVGASCSSGCDVVFANEGSDVAGWYVGTSAPPAGNLGFPIAVSATPICDGPWGDGACLYIRAQSANATVSYSVRRR